MPPKPAPQLFGLHVLRGVAALLIAIFHTLIYLDRRMGAGLVFPYEILTVGVDIFFVLSGFLMVHTTYKAWGGKLDRRRFLARRIQRIVPLYWLATAAVTVIMLKAPHLAITVPDMPTYLRSLLFVPTELHEGITTLLGVGWTLVYEMLFYLTFALFLGFNYRMGLVGLGVLFGGLAALSPWADTFYLAQYTSPLMLEFMYGIGLALLYRKVQTLPLPFVALIGAVALCCMGYVLQWPRFIGFGVPAFLAVYAFLGLPFHALSATAHTMGKALGDMSYALYLSHGYALRIPLLVLGVVPGVSVAMVGFSVLCGYLIFLCVDKPFQAWVARKA